jgi:hypothetical protein
MSHYCVSVDKTLYAFGTYQDVSRDWIYHPMGNCIVEGNLNEISDFHMTVRTHDRMFYDFYPSLTGISEINVLDGPEKKLIARYYHKPKYYGFCRIDHHVKCNDTGSVAVFDIPTERGRGVAIWCDKEL